MNKITRLLRYCKIRLAYIIFKIQTSREPEYPKDLHEAVWDLIHKKDFSDEDEEELDDQLAIDGEIGDVLQYYHELDIEYWQQADNEDPITFLQNLMYLQELKKDNINEKNKSKSL